VIEQQPIAGLHLQRMNLTVIVHSGRADMAMNWIYYRTSRYPSVELS
jgi:hypothetical protein